MKFFKIIFICVFGIFNNLYSSDTPSLRCTKGQLVSVRSRIVTLATTIWGADHYGKILEVLEPLVLTYCCTKIPREAYLGFPYSFSTKNNKDLENSQRLYADFLSATLLDSMYLRLSILLNMNKQNKEKMVQAIIQYFTYMKQEGFNELIKFKSNNLFDIKDDLFTQKLNSEFSTFYTKFHSLNIKYKSFLQFLEFNWKDYTTKAGTLFLETEENNGREIFENQMLDFLTRTNFVHFCKQLELENQVDKLTKSITNTEQEELEPINIFAKELLLRCNNELTAVKMQQICNEYDQELQNFDQEFAEEIERIEKSTLTLFLQRFLQQKKSKLVLNERAQRLITFLQAQVDLKKENERKEALQKIWEANSQYAKLHNSQRNIRDSEEQKLQQSHQKKLKIMKENFDQVMSEFERQLLEIDQGIVSWERLFFLIQKNLQAKNSQQFVEDKKSAIQQKQAYATLLVQRFIRNIVLPKIQETNRLRQEQIRQQIQPMQQVGHIEGVAHDPYQSVFPSDYLSQDDENQDLVPPLPAQSEHFYWSFDGYLYAQDSQGCRYVWMNGQWNLMQNYGHNVAIDTANQIDELWQLNQRAQDVNRWILERNARIAQGLEQAPHPFVNYRLTPRINF